MTASTPVHARPYLAFGLAAVLVAAGACKTDPTNTECQNDRWNIRRPTDGKMLAFGLNPLTISYHYLDVRQDTIEYTWDTTRIYYGWACLRFQTTDSVRIKPEGTFQFLLDGSNAAQMLRRIVTSGGTINDSVIGYVFRGCEGDGGTYRVLPDSTISLSWRNGQQEGIFDARATHTLSGDSVRTVFSIGTPADSVSGSWRLSWGRAYCGEGF